MRLSVTEDETKKAVCEMLKKRGYDVKPEQLQPIMEKDGQWEDEKTFQTGWYFDLPELKEENHESQSR